MYPPGVRADGLRVLQWTIPVLRAPVTLVDEVVARPNPRQNAASPFLA